MSTAFSDLLSSPSILAPSQTAAACEPPNALEANGPSNAIKETSAAGAAEKDLGDSYNAHHPRGAMYDQTLRAVGSPLTQPLIDDDDVVADNDGELFPPIITTAVGAVGTAQKNRGDDNANDVSTLTFGNGIFNGSIFEALSSRSVSGPALVLGGDFEDFNFNCVSHTGENSSDHHQTDAAVTPTSSKGTTNMRKPQTAAKSLVAALDAKASAFTLNLYQAGSSVTGNTPIGNVGKHALQTNSNKNNDTAVVSCSGSEAATPSSITTPLRFDPLPVLASLSDQEAHTRSSPTTSAAEHRLEEEEAEEQTNIYVGGIPLCIGDEQLRSIFEPFGTICSAKVMLHIHTGQSRGIGFVKFQEHSAAKEAINACNGKILNGFTPPKRITVRFSDAKAMYRPGELTNKVFIRNIPLDVGAHKLIEYFEDVGDVKECTLQLDTAAYKSGGTGVKSRIAYMTFSTVEEAKAATAKAHGKRPFDPNFAALMAKVAESDSKRAERQLRAKENEVANVAKSPQMPPPLPTGATWTERMLEGATVSVTPVCMPQSLSQSATGLPLDGGMIPGLISQLVDHSPSTPGLPTGVNKYPGDTVGWLLHSAERAGATAAGQGSTNAKPDTHVQTGSDGAVRRVERCELSTEIETEALRVIQASQPRAREGAKKGGVPQTPPPPSVYPGALPPSVSPTECPPGYPVAGYPPHMHPFTADASSYAASYHPNPYGLHHHPHSGYGYGGHAAHYPTACPPHIGSGGIPSYVNAPEAHSPPLQEPCLMRLLNGQLMNICPIVLPPSPSPVHWHPSHSSLPLAISFLNEK